MHLTYTDRIVSFARKIISSIMDFSMNAQTADRAYMSPSCEVILMEVEGNLCASGISGNEPVDEIDGEW